MCMVILIGECQQRVIIAAKLRYFFNMLEPIRSALGAQRVILASSSPRRQEILKSVGLIFEVMPSLFEENLDPSQFDGTPEFVKATAEMKVDELENRLLLNGEKYGVIIGADTMVALNNKIYGKPKSEDEARHFLKLLSGNEHVVFTGVCVKTPFKMLSFCEETKVEFGKLPDEVIDCYVKTGEPMDKAGGYGIQGRGASLIARINGDYFNVVGLPLHRLCSALYELFK